MTPTDFEQLLADDEAIYPTDQEIADALADRWYDERRINTRPETSTTAPARARS